MTRDQTVQLLQAQAPTLRALGATSVYLFGSVAHGTARPGSDVDLFVDYDETSGFSLVELARLQQRLEQQLGVPVDVTTRDSLDRTLRPAIEASAVRIF